MDDTKETEKQSDQGSSAESEDTESALQASENSPEIESTETTEGPDRSEKEASGAGDESNDDDPGSSEKDEQHPDDSQVVDTEPKEADSAAAPDSNDEKADDGGKSELTEEGKEPENLKEDTAEDSEDNEGKDDQQKVAPDDTGETVPSDDTGRVENLDSAEEDQETSGDDKKEKDPSEQNSSRAEDRDPIDPEPVTPEQDGQTRDDSEAAEIEGLPEAEKKKKPGKKTSWIKAALSAVLILAVFSGFFIFENKSKIKSNKKKKSDIIEKKSATNKKFRKSKSSVQFANSNRIYHAKIEEVSMLREALLQKKIEINQLKNHYQQGIADLEKEIFNQLRSGEINTFLKALESKRIEFGLRTIQRRQAYIRQLDRPSEWIYQACEELLYLKRRTLVDLQVTEVASGIDMNTHMRHMNAAIQKYRPTPDKLAVEMTDAQLEPLETLWEGIQVRSLEASFDPTGSDNQVIFEQVCAGNFKRAAELSEMTVEAAKCIAEMQGSDLFLNDLIEISPRAARHLFQWKGNWICLNGFRALSPRVADYLFQWDGSWISLNGLTGFPDEIGQVLLQWPGKQLELMGLKYTENSSAKIGIQYLAQWERSGGKLFVPATVREKIKELNGS